MSNFFCLGHTTSGNSTATVSTGVKGVFPCQSDRLDQPVPVWH